MEGVDDADEAAVNDEVGALQSPGGRSGRLLKRPREAASEQQDVNGLEDDDMEDAAPVEVRPHAQTSFLWPCVTCMPLVKVAFW